MSIWRSRETLSDWEEADARTDEFLRRKGVRYRRNGKAVARAGFAFWVGFGVLGAFDLTRPVWTWAMIIVGSFLIVDIAFENIIDFKESRPGSGFYQAILIPFGDKVVSPYKAYLVFVLLMLATAFLADRLVGVAQGVDSLLPLWASSLMWSIPVSGVLSLKMLDYYRETIRLRRKKR